VILHAYGIFPSGAGAGEELRDFAQSLSAGGWVAALAGCLIVWVVFGWLIRFLMTRIVPANRPSSCTNTVTEALVALLVLQIAGPPVAYLIKLGATLLLPRQAVECSGGKVAITILVDFLVVAGLWYFAFHRRAGARWWDLGLRGVGSLLLVMPVAYLSFMPIHFSVVWLWSLLLARLGVPVEPQPILLKSLEEGGASLLVVAVGAATLVPLLEEILFRGALYRSLREQVGPAKAAFLSALVFAACHRSPAGFGPIFVLALLLAYAYEKTGSLWAAVLLHSFFNATSFAVA